MKTIVKTFAAAAFVFAGFGALPALADNTMNAPDFYAYETPAAAHADGQWRATYDGNARAQTRVDDIKGRYNGFSQSSDGQGYIFN